MLWLYLTILSVIGTATANVFIRLIMRNDKTNALASSIVFQILGAVIVGIFAFSHGFVFPPILKYPFNFLLQAVFWGLATLSLFKANRYLEASESTIIISFQSIVTIITALLFLKERFIFNYAIGAFLILFSVIYISYKKSQMKLNQGVFYALSYCFLAGIASTNDAYLLRRLDALSYLTIGFLNPAIFLLLINPTVVRKMKPALHFRIFIKTTILSFFYSLAAIAFFLAIAVGGQVSQISPINQSAIVLTIIISAIFLNEKDNIFKKIFCAFLIVIGVFLLS